MKKYMMLIVLVYVSIFLAACSSTPQTPPDKRVAEQKQAAEGAQQELSRAVNN